MLCVSSESDDDSLANYLMGVNLSHCCLAQCVLKVLILVRVIIWTDSEKFRHWVLKVVK